MSTTSAPQTTSGILAAQQKQFTENFILQTTQAMNDNSNQTQTAIEQSHAQAITASTSGAAQVGEANSKIVA